MTHLSVNEDDVNLSEPSSFLVSITISSIRSLASQAGFEEIELNKTSRVISFYNRDMQCRVNGYYTTGTVATCLIHPISIKTQLFRRNVTLAELSDLFVNPRTQSYWSGILQTRSERSKA